jgi:valyl-tRNA synthetase
VLAYALDVLLRLLHPMIPFLTEEVWQLLAVAAPQRGVPAPVEPAPSICVAPWPVADASRVDARIEEQFADFQAVLGAVREIRMGQNIAPREPISFVIRCETRHAELLEPMRGYFQQMAKAQLTALGPAVTPPERSASKALPGMEIHVDVSAFFDVEAETARLRKERDQLTGHVANLRGKLANENFVSRAPAEVVQAQREKLAEVEGQLASIVAQLEKIAPHS